MGTYTLEIGEDIYRVKCECCGQYKKRVWGFVCRDGDAHAVYYALLNVNEQQPRVGLTLSVGPWWEDTEPAQRSWVHAEVWPEEDGVRMTMPDPKESNFYPWEKGGAPIDPEQARTSNAMKEIWAVAEFIVETDRAVTSYLQDGQVDQEGRTERDSADAGNSC